MLRSPLSLKSAGANAASVPSVEVYSSATTRVFRLGGRSAELGVVCKEHLGAQAAFRLQREKDVLAHLAGIRGVVQLAEGSYSAEFLALHDCGAITLAQRLRDGPCEVRTALAIAIELARTLGEVHGRGVIHRDVNPSNIVLAQALRPVLIDFDAALRADGCDAAREDEGGRMVGTLAYLAPEQSGRTGRTVDERADLYALGATLYEMVTGRPPFDDPDALALVHAHLTREPLAPVLRNDTVPAALSDITLRLLAKQPDQRYHSAQGLLHDLCRLRDALSAGQSDAFELGSGDFAARLVPAQLVGREQEREQIRAAFTDMLAGRRRAVLIEGPPGVGKSVLIEELRPLARAAAGRFVMGKFDQFHQTEGAGAGTQALRMLGRLLLTEPDETLAVYRARLLDKLGRHGALITKALPEFAALLGEQAQAGELDLTQVEAPLVQASIDLLGALVSPAQPLVLVLDDLQWANALSLRFFEQAVLEPGLHGLLVVGVYRSGDPQGVQLLEPMLHRCSRQEPPPVQVGVRNLGQQGVTELLQQMLRLPSQRAGELAEAVTALSGGNPFDTVETVNALRNEGVLRLQPQGWQWDAPAVERFVRGADVVQLLAQRIAGLPAPSRQLLDCMSCVGDSMESALLGAACGLDTDSLHERLRPLIANGLVLAEGETPQFLRFRHDRVQQAVQQTLDDARRASLQHDMARRLAAGRGWGACAARLYLDCLDRIVQAGERRAVAQLLWKVGCRLCDIALFARADAHLAAAGALLGADSGSGGDTTLRFQIDEARHLALYGLGRLDEADAVHAALQEHTTDTLALVQPACLQIRSLDMRGRMNDSLELGRRLLERLGVHVPQGYEDASIDQRLDSLRQWVEQDSRIDPRHRPLTTAPDLRAVARLLGRMARSAYFSGDMPALTWLMLECQRLWAEHGPCPELVVGLARMPVMLVRRRGDYRCGFEILKHAVEVGEALGFEPETSEVRHVFGMFGVPWFRPLEEGLNHMASAAQGIRKSGDVSYAGYVDCTYIDLLVDLAPNLAAGDSEIQAALARARHTRNRNVQVLLQFEQQLVRAMRGETTSPGSFDDAQFDSARCLQECGTLPFIRRLYYTRRCLTAALFQDATALSTHSKAAALLGFYPAYFLDVHTHLLRALSLAWELQSPSQDTQLQRPALHAELQAMCDWLAARAADQPGWLHLLRLAEAEQSWASGDLWRACAGFDAALAAAESRPQAWQPALIAERAARFHLAHGHESTGRKWLAESRDRYRSWGALGKVRALENECGWLGAPLGTAGARDATRTQHHGKSISADSLALLGVLRASQALSSETNMERLTARVGETVAELTGATQVRILARHETRGWLALPDTTGQPPILPRSVIAYAERTGQPLVVDDACTDDRFARDPYFLGRRCCSVLVIPIASQRSARAMILLENETSHAAFSPQRQDAVLLIAGQLAVSLNNAQLYESLESRVRERTRELQEAQAQLVATARHAGRAEIANNVLHSVGNVLNSVNVSTRLARRTLGQSRIPDLRAATSLLDEHAGHLDEFTKNDPRGRVLATYLNKAAQACESERQQVLQQLDGLVRSIDHLKEIVATQQAHAGASSVLQTTDVRDILEEALRISSVLMNSLGVVVVRQFEDIAPLLLDRSRILQILLNLIANASHAMQEVPREARELTLAAALVRDHRGQRLRITVRDKGMGIAPSTLASIFAHGFTTKKSGHGFGLHGSAIAAIEMGGTLVAHSEGLGRGALFTLELPAG